MRVPLDTKKDVALPPFSSSETWDHQLQEDNINVSYQTFWNDFSHYSFYGRTQDMKRYRIPTTQTAQNYDTIDQESHASENTLFSDIDQYEVTPPQWEDAFGFTQNTRGANGKIESFLFDPMWLGPDSEPVEADFFAHIPQDFNLDIHTSGNILGVNPGDSKLLAMECDLRALRGSINVRRIKAENCNLEASQKIKVGSSLETHTLQAKAGPEGF